MILQAEAVWDLTRQAQFENHVNWNYPFAFFKRIKAQVASPRPATKHFFLSVCVPIFFVLSQVQNISQSMEVLDLRTYRDLQYVRDTESLMKVVDGRLKVASENPRSLNPKGFQVIGRLSSPSHE